MKLALAAVASLLILIAVPFQSAEASDPPAFVYGGAEVTSWWNNAHPHPSPDRITLATGRTMAHYFNGLTWRALSRYLAAVAAAQVPYGANWDRVAACESGGNWSINTGNGYYGGVQFSLPTWQSVGGSGYPHQNSRAEQIRRAEILRQRSGLGQWPVCGSRWYG